MCYLRSRERLDEELINCSEKLILVGSEEIVGELLDLLESRVSSTTYVYTLFSKP